MAKKVRVVLNRKAFGTEALHKAVKPVMDDVQEQVEGMAAVDPAIRCTATRTLTAPTWSPPPGRVPNRPTEC